MHLFDRLDGIEDRLREKHWPTGFKTWMGLNVCWSILGELVFSFPYMGGLVVDGIQLWLWLVAGVA